MGILLLGSPQSACLRLSAALFLGNSTTRTPFAASSERARAARRASPLASRQSRRFLHLATKLPPRFVGTAVEQSTSVDGLMSRKMSFATNRGPGFRTALLPPKADRADFSHRAAEFCPLERPPTGDKTPPSFVTRQRGGAPGFPASDAAPSGQKSRVVSPLRCFANRTRVADRVPAANGQGPLSPRAAARASARRSRGGSRSQSPAPPR